MRRSYFSFYTKSRLSKRLEEKGKLAEKRAEMALKHSGRVWRGKTKELYFKNFTLVGRADFVSEREVVEVKAKLNPAFLLPNMAQLNLYLLMEGKPTGVLLFGDGNIIKLRRSDFLIRQSLKYFETLAEHIVSCRVPEGDRIFCKNCSFRHFCID
jgi:CRISPR/Cas system-associated exonuclease Cas4 (RecB family)